MNCSGFSSSIPELGPTHYGIADNNRIEGPEPKFNYFTNPRFKELHVVNVRRTVPWDLAWEGIHKTSTLAQERYAELKKWVTEVKALGGKTGQPTVSFDECSSEWVNPLSPTEHKSCTTTVPTQAQYKSVVEAFTKDSTLGQVKYLTAWNEPNHHGKFAEPSAKEAGRYWRTLDDLCVLHRTAGAKCTVAAGDFSDYEMANANDPATAGGAYFETYRHYMGRPPKGTHWAWHSYDDGEAVLGKADPTKWWTRFRHFAKALERTTHKGHPDIWLTEQGVVVSRNGRPAVAAGGDKASIIMHAYVENGEHQLTRQSRLITRFFYCETRGAEGVGTQDSGLLCPQGSKEKHCPRSIFYVYRNKTPKK